MCFSATASFAASGGLAAVSAATLKVAPKSKRFLALIPFFFAVQQLLEGIQWLALKAGSVCTAAGYGYLTFALVVWPVFVPATVYWLDRRGRRVSRWFLALGIGIAVWLGISLWGPLGISLVAGNIVYSPGIPAREFAVILYIIAVGGALLTSRIRALQWFGVLAVSSAVVAFFWFRSGFPSVWCYFAAVISVLVFFYARSLRHTGK